MKEENKQLVDEFLSHSDEFSEDILNDFEEILGTVPFIFKVLRERPNSFLLNTLAEYETFRPESLDGKTAELITIAAASAANADKCLKVHINAALKAGATRDEIMDTILIACLVGKTKLLATSLRTFKDTCGDAAQE